MIKQLRMNEDFARPLGPAIPKPAPAAPQPVQIKPGIWQAPDGKLRTDFATGQSVAPAPKAAPVAPLPVVPNALGDWIAHEGGECPIHGPGEWMLRHRDGKEFFSNIDPRGYSSQWRHASPTPGAHIVAYRLIP